VGTGYWLRCWRCGEIGPYWLCDPCCDVVSPEDIAWVQDPDREPGKTPWEMTPMGKPQGRE
jgi:hypothetical protein